MIAPDHCRFAVGSDFSWSWAESSVAGHNLTWYCLQSFKIVDVLNPLIVCYNRYWYTVPSFPTLLFSSLIFVCFKVGKPGAPGRLQRLRRWKTCNVSKWGFVWETKQSTGEEGGLYRTYLKGVSNSECLPELCGLRNVSRLLIRNSAGQRTSSNVSLSCPIPDLVRYEGDVLN